MSLSGSGAGDSPPHLLSFWRRASKRRRYPLVDFDSGTYGKSTKNAPPPFECVDHAIRSNFQRPSSSRHAALQLRRQMSNDLGDLGRDLQTLVGHLRLRFFGGRIGSPNTSSKESPRPPREKKALLRAICRISP